MSDKPLTLEDVEQHREQTRRQMLKKPDADVLFDELRSARGVIFILTTQMMMASDGAEPSKGVAKAHAEVGMMALNHLGRVLDLYEVGNSDAA